tara:strand:- start:2426 stop:3250 length:825 start_codon:yes stop_codon:yes gene_type:complete
MEYLTGYTIKPHQVTPLGEVLFTDGTNTGLMTNQVTCEAYGYTYDIASGTCSSFRFNANLERNISNINNKNNGSGNTNELGSNTIQVNGSNNTTKGFNNNCFINGSNNEIANGVDNATVLGNYGIAERDGEVVIGGGGGVRGEGGIQSSTFSLYGRTTSASTTNLYINNSTTNTIIDRSSTSSFQGFEANVIGIRTGGSAGGSVNDRIFLRVTGIVYLKVVDETAATLGSFGTVTGWTSGVVFLDVNDMHLEVTGAANMNISWSATMNFYEMKI